MTRHTTQDFTTDTAAEPMLADVLAWARAAGEKRDAIYELEKVPARLGDRDLEIDLIPADLAHFERKVAPAPYGAVAKRARDVETARRRGNSRLRKLLERFWAAHGGPVADPEIRESYDALIDAVRDREGFPAGGAELSTSSHKPLCALRARCRVPLAALDQAEIDRVWAEATPNARERLRAAIDLIARLKRGGNAWPEIAALLPPEQLTVPASPDRAQRIVWETFPQAFRHDAEPALRRALGSKTVLAEDAREMRRNGASAAEINAYVAEQTRGRKRPPDNAATAMAGYRQAVTWLAREQRGPDGSWQQLTGLAGLFNEDALEAACEAQIARSEASATLKDPRTSQTFHSRLTNLTTVARYGLRDAAAVGVIDAMRIIYHDYIITPKQMTDEAEHFCTRLRDHPHLAAAFVNAPARLADEAAAAVAAAKAAGDKDTEAHALRLYAAAVLFAVQLSRPLRTRNLFTIRLRAVGKCPRTMTWIENARHAELKFPTGEVKNGHAIRAHVMGGDAEILWDWVKTHRPRLVELRGLEISPYLVPGHSRPRLVNEALHMPAGCLSPATQVELWALGERRLGIGLAPHQCRHAVATLMLAVDPGNFARVASVLGDTEETVRKHYGKDSGEAAASAVREALLAHHPDIFRQLQRRAA